MWRLKAPVGRGSPIGGAFPAFRTPPPRPRPLLVCFRALLVAAVQESGLRVEIRGGPDCGSAPWSCLGGDLRSSRALLVILDADISKHPIRRRSLARKYWIQKRLTYVHL